MRWQHFSNIHIRYRLTWYLTLTLLFTATPVLAMWAKYSNADLIEKSELIVEARFMGTTEVLLPNQQHPLSLGVLQVSKVLKGKPQTEVVLLALPSKSGLVSSTDIHYRQGQVGLWFLYQKSGGISGVYYADHPQRFLPSDSKGPAAEELRKMAQGL
jgi:hypothetical protein